MNAEIYPGGAARGSPPPATRSAFHAWCHEDWGGLTPAQEAENLDRGLAALRALGLDVAGFRPPGGLIGPSTAALLAARGVRHCSPAGSGAGHRRRGRAAAVRVAGGRRLPRAAAVRGAARARQRVGGAGRAGRGARGAAGRDRAAVADGGHAVLVLHTWMAEGVRDALRDVLARCAAGAASGELWVARCDAVAAWVAGAPGGVRDAGRCSTARRGPIRRPQRAIARDKVQAVSLRRAARSGGGASARCRPGPRRRPCGRRRCRACRRRS